jgi:hypothetical protein
MAEAYGTVKKKFKLNTAYTVVLQTEVNLGTQSKRQLLITLLLHGRVEPEQHMLSVLAFLMHCLLVGLFKLLFLTFVF